MPVLELESESILVIKQTNNVPQEVWEEISDSISKSDWNEQIYQVIGLKPDSYYEKTREWLAQRGVKWDGIDENQYVLWEL